MENHYLTIRARIPLEYYIKFSEWVPRLDSPLHLTLKEKISDCKLYTSDENIRECNRHWINPQTSEPLTFEEILQRDLIYANEISIDFRIEGIESDTLSRLKNGEDNYGFAFEINCLIIDTINRFLYFVRNHLGQYVVELIPYHKKDLTLANFVEWNAEYKIDDEALWHAFRPAHFNRLTVETVPIVLLMSSPIKKQYISYMNSFIYNDQKSNMPKILVVNARTHFVNCNYRMALVEAVIALESTIKLFLQKAIGKRYGGHEISKREIESFWRDVGLSSMMLVGLRWWFSDEEIPDELLLTVFDAIDTRNNIIHNMQRRISREKTKEYLGAIFTLCDYITEEIDTNEN